MMASVEAVLLPFICRIQDQEQQQQKLYYVGHRRQVEEESQNEDYVFSSDMTHDPYCARIIVVSHSCLLNIFVKMLCLLFI